MSTVTSLRGIGRQIDDRESLGPALDELVAARTEPPTMLALGEPTHGMRAFPLLRNDFLAHLVERGYRSIILETDIFAAALVNDYVNGETAEIELVLATGFSHGFGAVPGNRELIEWLRTYNAGRAEPDRVGFYGFDAPIEFAGAPSPRQALSAVIDYLPASLLPVALPDLNVLLGADADWTNPAAMYDSAASVGASDNARDLRIIADDLARALNLAAPSLGQVDSAGYVDAVAQARTAVGLLRYHAAMAGAGTDRIATLLGLRAEMMAANLLAIGAREQRRGPSLVFAHNAHLQPTRSAMSVGGQEQSWASAGAIVELNLRDGYVFLATDANPESDAATLQGMLAAATTRRTLFPGPALRAVLPASTGRGKPIVPGHLPLNPAELDGVAAVIFIADTDGERHQYW